MIQRLLCTLLHYANAGVHWPHAEDFYPLKEKLLKRYGQFVGHQIQEIRKECHGPWERVFGERVGCLGKRCPRCLGTGIYDIRWVRLERWEWCGRVFHRPIDASHITPSPYPPRDMIYGIIEHPDYGKASDEARLWLYLLCGEWKLFLRECLSQPSYCQRTWWPLLCFQRVVFWLGMHFARERCPQCGRKYFSNCGNRHSCYCRKCRRAMAARGEELPF